MSAVIFKENIFILEDARERKIELLNCKNLFSNKSSMPMHSLVGSSGRTIPRFLIQLLNLHKKQWGETETVEYLLLDTIITSFLIRQSRPMQVVEIGGDNGILSFHLASLLGGFQKESFFCSVCRVIGNESENYWLDRISIVQEKPELSLLISDYEKTCLLDHFFDLVVINGTINFLNPYLVLKEAERLVKLNGNIVLFLQDMPLLEDIFKLNFSERKEYYLKVGTGVLIKENWKKEEEKDKKKQDNAIDFIEEVKSKLKGDISLEQARDLLQRIDSELDRVIAEYDIEQKLKLIQAKENVLDIIVSKKAEK